MTETRKTKELSETWVPSHFHSLTFMQITNALLLRTVWGGVFFFLFCEVSLGIYKVHYFALFQNWWNERKKDREQYKGVREVVETAFDKMSAAPELNPGDWKWIECISPYIDSRWHRRDSDGERGELEWVNEWDEDEEKEHREGRKRAVVCYRLTTGAFQTPLLSHYTITVTEGPVFTQPYSILVQRQAFWLPRWASHNLTAPSTPGNGHNWKSQTNSWMTWARGHWVSRG